VYTIRRDELHDGDTIWLMDDDDQLNVRRVEIAYHGRDEVYVPGGIEPGARLVTSDLAAPIAGMPLRTGDEPTSATRPARDAGADRRGGARP